MVESIAQLGAVAVLADERFAGKLPLFGGVDGARFRRQVGPGRHPRARGRAGPHVGPGRQGPRLGPVGGELACEADLLFVLVDAPGLSDGRIVERANARQRRCRGPTIGGVSDPVCYEGSSAFLRWWPRGLVLLATVVLVDRVAQVDPVDDAVRGRRLPPQPLGAVALRDRPRTGSRSRSRSGGSSSCPRTRTSIRLEYVGAFALVGRHRWFGYPLSRALRVRARPARRACATPSPGSATTSWPDSATAWPTTFGGRSATETVVNSPLTEADQAGEMMRQPLWPPKPNEFDRVGPGVHGRASVTMSMGASSGSGSP